jgi:hypothetical protein
MNIPRSYGTQVAKFEEMVKGKAKAAGWEEAAALPNHVAAGYIAFRKPLATQQQDGLTNNIIGTT